MKKYYTIHLAGIFDTGEDNIIKTIEREEKYGGIFVSIIPGAGGVQQIEYSLLFYKNE